MGHGGGGDIDFIEVSRLCNQSANSRMFLESVCRRIAGPAQPMLQHPSAAGQIMQPSANRI